MTATTLPPCEVCGGPAPTSPDDSSHDDCYEPVMSTWMVHVVEDGFGQVVWQGPAGDALEAVRAYGAASGRTLPPSPLDGFRDVNRDGSRYESEGSCRLVVERV